MLSITGSRRRRAAAAVLCLGLAFGLMVAGSAADQASAVTDSERAMVRLVNNTRRNHGLSGLKISWKLSGAAHRHSERMARRGSLHEHSCLPCVLDKRGITWRIAGENVGYGSTLRWIHRAMMRSTIHRSNILNRGYRRIGIGVVKRSGRYWVTEIFYG
ncbi:MAG TPA: CAP domain-containing protein [Actinomycetota bacterium]|nr:CAP domain-containing protein [Actinomycetota bacterium]